MKGKDTMSYVLHPSTQRAVQAIQAGFWRHLKSLVENRNFFSKWPGGTMHPLRSHLSTWLRRTHLNGVPCPQCEMKIHTSPESQKLHSCNKHSTDPTLILSVGSQMHQLRLSTVPVFSIQSSFPLSMQSWHAALNPQSLSVLLSLVLSLSWHD